ncbi:hypothetical protein LPTSP4_19860 [Leptospira ryugenii]|uniref:DUF2817 domain-containing protein n=1 Tax=Leptospira ryugenii TaxID=1917863 RepID=A0A2P2E0Q3_9LEPT|nr:M14 family metallopeptidase [Leptospira ryugenii]GBF50461.1 hypothetical protein LPTSP4_19860 [Leptospira ryugenii]
MTNTLHTNKNQSAYTKALFFETYEECRKDFLILTKKVKKKFPESRIEKITFSKVEDPIDSFFFQPKKKRSNRLILITSGIHGVEGFTGSAVQRLFLQEILSGNFAKGCDYFFLHGINTFGFKNRKRVNENNIDLNRNFFFKKEKIPKKERNLGYRRFASFFTPKFPFTFLPLEFAIFFLRFLGIMLRIGITNFSNAFVRGQYEYKEGLYFGGKRPETVVKRLKRNFKDQCKGYKSILHLDLHTGHGEANDVVLIQNADLGSKEDQFISQVTNGQSLLKPGSGGAFYKTAGDFTDLLSKILPNDKEIIPLTVEIGTTGNTKFLQAVWTSFLIVAENRIRHYGSWFQKNRYAIEEKFFRYFYPDSEFWRYTILMKTRDMMHEIIRQFCEFPSK